MLDQLQAKFDATEKATAWLIGQLEGLEVQVSESERERAVEIYREAHGLTKGTTTSIQDEQLSEINSQLIVARADRTVRRQVLADPEPGCGDGKRG
jgi:succinoglycan biosynthesis transport protein ExoP